MRHLWLGFVVLFGCAAACGDSGVTYTGPLCGEDTTRDGKECLPMLACGEDTVLSGFTCEPTTTTTCGADTHLEGDVCVVDASPTCGEDTTLVGFACVVDVGPSCGTGTTLNEGQCVVDDVLECSTGTTRVENECVALVSGSSDTVETEGAYVSRYETVENPYDACTVTAIDFCGEILSCCGAFDFNPEEDTLFLPYLLRDPISCESLVEYGCLESLETQLKALVLGQATPADDYWDVISDHYLVEGCLVDAGVLDTLYGWSGGDITEPAQGFGSECLGNFTCIEGFTCVEDTPDNPTCRTPGTSGVACDAYDSADCAEGHYCTRPDTSWVCLAYADIGESCATDLCDPDTAFCNTSDECETKLLGGDSCTADGDCQAQFYCSETTGCTLWPIIGASCLEDNRCGPELVCIDEICVDAEDVCSRSSVD